MEVFVNIGTEIRLETYDPENEQLTITASPILPGATFTDDGNGNATYTYNPDSLAVGSINDIMFIVTDPYMAADTVNTTIQTSMFKRGDLDRDEKYTMNDIVVIVNYIFREGSLPNPADAGDIDYSGSINVADISYLVNYMYKSGPKPPQ